MNDKLKYKCLILDHDDTVMDSTTHIHYPSFLLALEELRPGTTISLEDYFRVNFDPGFLPYCTGVLGLTAGELDRELEIWKDYVKDHIPKFSTEWQGSSGGRRRWADWSAWSPTPSTSTSAGITRQTACRSPI